MICVFGAGSIGCYVGGRLAAGGSHVRFIGRGRLVPEIVEHGLHLTDWQGADLRVAPDAVRFENDPGLAADADLVLVTVKSAATEEVGRTLAPLLKPGAVVISFQNGLHNAETLRAAMPARTVLTGMVEFNVLHRGLGNFHHGTQGGLGVERHAALAPFLPSFQRSGIALTQFEQMRSAQWGKLLLNLNNAVNALSNLPLKQELSQRDYRRCLALAQAETLVLLHAAGITPAKLTGIPPTWIPHLLRLPDFLFHRLARRMLAIDPLARSSMWEDLEAGRTTEVDWLNGEVVQLAASLGHPAPVNARLTTLIHDAEHGGERRWQATALLRELLK